MCVYFDILITPDEPDSYMAMNPSQKRSNSAGFLCTSGSNSLPTPNRRSSASLSTEFKPVRDASANGNEGYMMMAPSAKGERFISLDLAS